jgi:hypothetical protein
MRYPSRPGFRMMKVCLPVIFTILLVISSLLLLTTQEGGADSIYKVPSANPTFTRGSIVSGSYVNVQTSDNTYMTVREWSFFFFFNYLDMSWNSWQAFSEAPRERLLDIGIELEGYQSDTGESWYVQFYDFDTGAWDATWYALGSLPTAPDGNLQVAVGDPTLSRTFVSNTGQFRLRFADAGTAVGTWEANRTDLYIDLLRARFVYDITPPVSTITAPLDQEQTASTSYTVTGTSSDPIPDASGVTLVEVSVDGGASWNPATPAVPGDYSNWSYDWDPIPAEGAYNIRSRATDEAGNVETPGAGVTLIVDWTPPQVGGATPPDGAINVLVSTSLQANFIEANNILAGTVNPSTFTLVDEEGTPISGAISYDPVSKAATFDPVADLFYGYNYTATLTTGITDLAGNPLAADYVWTFKTADILSMSLYDTYNRDGTPGAGAVNFGTMNPDGSPFIVGGGTPPYAVRLGVLSSTGWNMLVRATSDLTDTAQMPPPVIPIAQLQWELTGSGLWTPFTLSDAAVYPSARSRTPQPSGSEITFDLRLDLSWDDAPGSYYTVIVFTVMQQP